jgi:hypothetical protein
MKLIMESWRRYLREEVENSIMDAAKQILKPGFEILGHGTSVANAKSILSKGFYPRRARLNLTFLLVNEEHIIGQLQQWPYGEAGGSGGVGVVFMRIPEKALKIDDLQNRISVKDPEYQPPPPVDPADDLGAVSKTGQSTGKIIPSYFFFASWDVEKEKLQFNPDYDEAKIFEHFSDLDVTTSTQSYKSIPTPASKSQPEPESEDDDWDVF